jgi:hypothetical protein
MLVCIGNVVDRAGLLLRNKLLAWRAGPLAHPHSDLQIEDGTVAQRLVGVTGCWAASSVLHSSWQKQKWHC